MKKQNELSKKGLINLVAVACVGYLATAGIVGSAMFGSDFNNSAGRQTVASNSAAQQSGDKTSDMNKALSLQAGVSGVGTDLGTLAEKLPAPGEASNTSNPANAPSVQLANDDIFIQRKSTTGAATLNDLETGKPKQANSAPPAPAKPFKRHFDKKLLEAAAERAGEKIGDLRGSVDEDAALGIAKPKPRMRDLSTRVKKQVGANPVILQRPAWQPEQGSEKSLPPIVFNDSGEMLDMTTTGSIRAGSSKGSGDFDNWELKR